MIVIYQMVMLLVMLKTKTDISTRISSKRKQVVNSFNSLVRLLSACVPHIDQNSDTPLPMSFIEKLRIGMMKPYARLKNASLPRRLLVHKEIRRNIKKMNDLLVTKLHSPVDMRIFILWTPPAHSKFQPIELTWANTKTQFNRIALSKQCRDSPLEYMYQVSRTT